MADQRTLRVVVVGNASQAEAALNDLGDTAEQAGNGVGGLGGRFGGLKTAVAGMGPAILAALPIAAVAAFGKALESTQNKAKLAAQMGLSGADAEQAGKLAGDLYKAGFGESTADTGQVVRRVAQDLNMGLNDVDFQPVAEKVAALSQTMDKDVGETTRAISQLMRTGLAKNANDAMDIIAAGFTNGVDKSEDFLDTLNEYGTQFRKLGLDGATATGLISQGLKAGARDGDVVADALKEFSIRALDGSEASIAGFKALGLNADKMASQIAAGGPKASAGLQMTLDKLRAIKDPVERSRVAVQLFGTQAEDLGDALFALDPSSAVKALGDVSGAAEKMGDTLTSSAGAKVEAFKRRVLGGITDAFGGLISLGEKAVGPVREGLSRLSTAVGPALSGLWSTISSGASGLVTDLMPHLTAFGNFLSTTVKPLLVDLWAQAQPVIQQAGQTISAAFQGISAAVNFVVPIIQKLWKLFGPTILESIRGTFSGLMSIIKGAFKIIQGVWKVFSGLFTGDWKKMWSGLKDILSGAFTMLGGVLKVFFSSTIFILVRKGISKVTEFLLTLPGKLLEIGKDIVRGLANGIKGAFGLVMDAARALADKIPGPIKKILGIKSPSRVMMVIGRYVTEGLARGMSDTKPVSSAASKIIGSIKNILNRAKVADLTKKILDKQKEKLKDLKAARDDLARSIADSARSYGGIMGSWSNEEGADNSSRGIAGRMAAKINDIRKFRQNLAKLNKLGLSRSLISEIAGAGIENGSAMAAEILKGGSGAVQEFNALQSELNSESKALGSFVANDYYGAGISATQGIIKGLKAGGKALRQAIRELSGDMVKELRKLLGIKSPSRVFAADGLNAALGFAQGLNNGRGDVLTAVDGLAAARPGGRLASGALASSAVSAAGAASSTRGPIVNVTVQGNVTAERALARSVATVVRDEIVRNGKRNGGRTGL